MSDIVITVPKNRWAHWLSEGALPGETCPKGHYYYIRVHNAPKIGPGERVYVVAHGRLRGYSPLVGLIDSIPAGGDLDATLAQWREQHRDGVHFYLVRQGGAVAVTVPEPIPGFQGWRYRWWEREAEVPFPDWMELP